MARPRTTTPSSCSSIRHSISSSPTSVRSCRSRRKFSSAAARYAWQLEGGLDAFWQLGFKYSGDTINSLVDTPDEPNTQQDSYTIVNASAGIADIESGWGAELFINNLTDERAEIHINRQDFIERITTNRPRTIGLRIRYDY